MTTVNALKGTSTDVGLSSRREHLRLLGTTVIGGGLIVMAPRALAQAVPVSVPSMRAPGATDDSAAFLAAVQEAVQSGSHRVYLPENQGSQPGGSYLIGTPATNDDGSIAAGNLASSVEVFGDGKYRTIVRFKQTKNDPARVNGNSFIFFATKRNGVNANNITIRDMSLVGDSESKSEPSQALHMVQFGGVSVARIANVEFKESEGDGLNIGDPLQIPGTHNDNITVESCNFNGGSRSMNRNGISILDVNQCLITGCAFDRWGAPFLPQYPNDPPQPGAIDVEPEAVWSIVKNLTIKGCAFANLNNSAFSILWKNNTFTDPQALYNIFFEESTVRDSYRGFVFSAPNGITTTTPSSNVVVRSLYCERLNIPFEISNAVGAWLYGNSFNDCNQSLLAINGPIRDITIQNTSFVRCGRTNGPTIKQVGDVDHVKLFGTRAYDCGAPGQVSSIYYADGGQISRLIIFDTRAENTDSSTKTTEIARRNLAANVQSAYVECNVGINLASWGFPNLQTTNPGTLSSEVYGCPL